MPSRMAYFAVFAVAFGTTCVLTPLLRRVALRYRIVAIPNERRVHTVPIPYLGGVAMLLGFLGALGVAWQLDAFKLMFEGSSIPLGIALGAVILCVVGTVDDIREVSAPAKTAGMVLGGSVMYLFGVSLLYFRVPFAGSLLVLGPDLAPLISVLWVMGMVNAVNRIDCLGFLPYNFNPARIFMGDGGALMLGGLMGAATILVGGQSNEQFSGQVFFFFAPLFIPFFVMGVPIIDTVFAIVRRATKRVGLAEADKDHLHHRLMRLGHGQRRSVVIL